MQIRFIKGLLWCQEWPQELIDMNLTHVLRCGFHFQLVTIDSADSFIAQHDALQLLNILHHLKIYLGRTDAAARFIQRCSEGPV